MAKRPVDPKPDDLDPARGVLTGILLGVVVWALLVGSCFALMKG